MRAIGRDNITVMDMRVSRQHCILGRDEHGFYVIDTNSTNGTFLRSGTSEFQRIARGTRVYIDAASDVRLGAIDGPSIRIPVSAACTADPAVPQEKLPLKTDVENPAKSRQSPGCFEPGDYQEIDIGNQVITHTTRFDLSECEQSVIEGVLRDIMQNRRIKIKNGPHGPFFVSGRAHYQYAHERLRIPDDLIVVDCGFAQMSMAECKFLFAIRPDQGCDQDRETQEGL